MTSVCTFWKRYPNARGSIAAWSDWNASSESAMSALDMHGSAAPPAASWSAAMRLCTSKMVVKVRENAACSAAAAGDSSAGGARRAAAPVASADMAAFATSDKAMGGPLRARSSTSDTYTQATAVSKWEHGVEIYRRAWPI